jgi:DNA-3-methyladenine glycosylase I
LAQLMKETCGWGAGDPLMTAYHDTEWGVPVHDDRLHFELLVLEGVQAGLSWRTVLHRRDAYREAYHNFDPKKVATYTEVDIDRILAHPGIIRNRSKIKAAIKNAQSFLAVQKEFGTFDSYIWGFVGGKQRVNSFTSFKEMPAETEDSSVMSKDLKKKGFTFVGPTICYAYMQAAGLVNDHLTKCHRWKEVQE